MSAAGDWLASRLEGAPERLLEVMTVAVDRSSSEPVAEALADAAIALYDSVLSSQGRRGDALSLLAADALLTHAFQAQAESDPSQLGRFASRWSGSGRLAEVTV